MAIFSVKSLNSFLSSQQALLEKKIQDYDYRQLKEFTDEDYRLLCSNFSQPLIQIDFEHFTYANPRQGEDNVFNQESLIFQGTPQYVRVHGFFLTFTIPIISGGELVRYKVDPSFQIINFSDVNFQEITLSDDEMSITFDMFFPEYELNGKSKEDVSKYVKGQYLEFIKDVRFGAEHSNWLIKSFNGSLDKVARDAAQKKIKHDSTFTFFTDSLNVEVRPKNSAQQKGKRIEIVPKKADVSLPSRKKYEGYYIDKENYGAIIQTMKLHLIATEEHPEPVRALKDEELIRDTLLWALNANYFVANGEAFRNNGKTDILIKFKDKSAFVAECKVWKGPKYVSEAIDQLFGYTTWRDSKAAIVVFNLEKQDFSIMCSQLREIARNHKFFRRIVQDKDQEEFLCEFEDPNAEESVIEVTFLAANYVTR